MADDGKPQAGTRSARPRFSKAFEDSFAQVFGYAGAFVPNLQKRRATVLAQPDRDPTRPVGQRVVQEITDHVAQILGPTTNRNRFMGSFDFDGSAGFRILIDRS